MAARLARWLATARARPRPPRGTIRLWPPRGTARFRPPRRTVRFRLTALYSALFLAAATALIAVTYVLVDRVTTAALFVSRGGKSKIAVKAAAVRRSLRTFPRLHRG